MPSMVAALDCGTTAIKAAVIDLRGGVRGSAARPCTCLHGRDGGIETDPDRMVSDALGSLREAMRRSRIKPRDVAGLAVASQRATVVPADRAGKSAGNAISWQDMRGAAAIVSLQKRLNDAMYYGITGLPLHPVFTIGKILWMNSHDARRSTRVARYVLVHDYVHRALGCSDFFCDHSNASLTGLFDIERLDWSDIVLDACGVARNQLPTLVPSGQRIGELSKEAARRTGLLAGTPLISGGGDQQCAGLGAGATETGIAAVTLGTAAITQLSATHPVRDAQRRITCSVHAAPGKWIVEGLQNAAGASFDWWERICGRGLQTSAFMKEVSSIPAGAGGVTFFPYLAGSAAPHWDPLARGVLAGLQLTHDRATVARAIMEGVSIESREIMDVFAALGLSIAEVRLSGGCAANKVWNRILADLYGRPVRLLATAETTLNGAAMLAACGTGAMKSLGKAAAAMVRADDTLHPARDGVAAYERLYRRFVRLRQGMAAGGIFSASQSVVTRG